MPLVHAASQAAFQRNMATEVTAKKAEGYTPAKAASIAAAIAYRIKRAAAAKRRSHSTHKG